LQGIWCEGETIRHGRDAVERDHGEGETGPEGEDRRGGGKGHHQHGESFAQRRADDEPSDVADGREPRRAERTEERTDASDAEDQANSGRISAEGIACYRCSDKE